MATHIVLEESGLPYAAVRVNLKDKTTEAGEDYHSINAKGYVPSVRLDNGQLLTENTAVLAYMGELNPAAKLMPAAGSMENYRVREWLGFLSTELHKNVSPLFRSTTPEATMVAQRELLGRRLAYAEKALGHGPFLTGAQFTVADAYLFVILSWFARIKIDLAPYPNLKALLDRVAARPAVQKVMRDEGLLKIA
jgi:glutathione S-transferase